MFHLDSLRFADLRVWSLWCPGSASPAVGQSEVDNRSKLQVSSLEVGSLHFGVRRLPYISPLFLNVVWEPYERLTSYKLPTSFPRLSRGAWPGSREPPVRAPQMGPISPPLGLKVLRSLLNKGAPRSSLICCGFQPRLAHSGPLKHASHSCRVKTVLTGKLQRDTGS